MNTPQPTWDEMSHADRASHIRRQLATIQKALPYLVDVVGSGGHTSSSGYGSRIPLNLPAFSLRAEIDRDLVFWAGSIRREHPDHPTPLGGDLLGYLRRHAFWAAEWTYGRRLAYELEDLARDARNLAWPRSDQMLLGTCPNTIGADGEAVTCGAPIRVRQDKPGDIRCPGCGLTDTVDGWLLRIVPDASKPVTAEQLVPLLRRRLGVTVAPSTIRQWKRRGEIVAIGVDEQGRDLFDRHHAFLVVTRRDGRREA